MSIVTAMTPSPDGLHLFGADINGIIYAWSLGRILQEHISRKEELKKNNNVYTFVARWKVCSTEILHLKIYQQYFLIITAQIIYKIPNQLLYQYIDESDKNFSRNPNLIDLQEIVNSHSLNKLKEHYTTEFHISDVLDDYPLLYVGSHCGRIFVFNIEKEEIIQVNEVIDVVNDVVKSMVPIKKNPITTLNKINSNELLVGSSLGLMLILKLQESAFSSYLKYPDKSQTLSPVIKTVYKEDQCILVSLHDEHIAVWNITVQDLIKRMPSSGTVDIALSNDGVLIMGGDNGKLTFQSLTQVSQTRTVQTSQSIILGLQMLDNKNGKEILFVRGDTPFIDIFRQNSYQFTVACL